MTPDSERIIVARTIAALRRGGFSVLDALSFVAPTLEAGKLREEAERTLASLRAGTEGTTSDPLFAIAARGEAASADALDAGADALQAEDGARAARSSAALWLSILIVGPLLMGFVVGWSRANLDPLGGSTPGLTQFVYQILDVVKWIALPLAAIAVVVIRLLVRRAAPGVRELVSASALLQHAAVLESGGAQATADAVLARATLTPAEQQFLTWRKAQTNPADAARILAEELRVEARARAQVFAELVPVLGLLLIGLTAVSFTAAMYLPIFSVAGAIK